MMVVGFWSTRYNIIRRILDAYRPPTIHFIIEEFRNSRRHGFVTRPRDRDGTFKRSKFPIKCRIQKFLIDSRIVLHRRTETSKKLWNSVGREQNVDVAFAATRYRGVTTRRSFGSSAPLCQGRIFWIIKNNAISENVCVPRVWRENSPKLGIQVDAAPAAAAGNGIRDRGNFPACI